MAKIEKEETPIVAYTQYFKIEGKVYIPMGARLSDFISSAQQRKFIPVADGVVTDLAGNQVCRTEFLELNKDEIIFLVPETL